MNLSIETSIALLSAFNQRLEHGAPYLYAAINNGIAALETIQDGNYQLKNHLNAAYGKMRYKDTDSVGAVDLKTLYEQTTMYCEQVDERYQYFANGDIRKVEYYKQPDTPIRVVAVWKIAKSNQKLIEVSYQIGEETK